jgi:hypothetical protein
MRTLIILAIALVHGATPVNAAETLTWQGVRTCSSPNGYRSTTEWSRDGMQFGEDNKGNRWSTSRWQGLETTTGDPPHQ